MVWYYTFEIYIEGKKTSVKDFSQGAKLHDKSYSKYQGKKKNKQELSAIWNTNSKPITQVKSVWNISHSMSSTNLNLLSLFVKVAPAWTDMQAQPLVSEAILLYIRNIVYPGKTVGKHHKTFELRSDNLIIKHIIFCHVWDLAISSRARRYSYHYS